jgi:hypothetical protein
VKRRHFVPDTEETLQPLNGRCPARQGRGVTKRRTSQLNWNPPSGSGCIDLDGSTGNAGYTLYSLEFLATETFAGVSIFFDAAGGDNVGPMLDNVTLTAVPLPAAAWLLLSGLVGFAALGRRRTMAA